MDGQKLGAPQGPSALSPRSFQVLSKDRSFWCSLPYVLVQDRPLRFLLSVFFGHGPFKIWFETVKRTRDADWAGTYHCEVKNLVGGAVSRNVTVSSAYIRKNFLRDPRNSLCSLRTLGKFWMTPRIRQSTLLSANPPKLPDGLTEGNCMIGQSLQELYHRAGSDFFQNPPIQIKFILES